MKASTEKNLERAALGVLALGGLLVFNQVSRLQGLEDSIAQVQAKSGDLVEYCALNEGTNPQQYLAEVRELNPARSEHSIVRETGVLSPGVWYNLPDKNGGGADCSDPYDFSRNRLASTE